MIRASLNSEGAPPGYVWCREQLPEWALGAVGDPKTDEWVIKLRTAFEPADREKIYQEVYRYVHEQALSVPSLGGAFIHAFSPRIDFDHLGGQRVVALWATRWMPGYP